MQLSDLLDAAVERGASDLHLVVGESPIFRVAGQLIRTEMPRLDSGTIEELILPALNPRQASMLMNHAVDVDATIRNNGTAFRCNLFRAQGELGCAFRVIPAAVPALDELAFSSPELMQNLAKMSRGLVLIVGPTGSGKSTTAAAFIETINRTRAERIITLEDPITYVFSNKESVITQRTIGDDIASITDGARSLMMEDPDVILLSELRDMESVQLALLLAETGHLVFSTLHTETASDTIRRLIEAFPEPREWVRRTLARNLMAVISQNLVPRSGASGRVPVNEILIVTPRIREMIAAGQTDLTLAIEAERRVGSRTMDDDLITRFDSGLIGRDAMLTRLTDRGRQEFLTREPGSMPGNANDA